MFCAYIVMMCIVYECDDILYYSISLASCIISYTLYYTHTYIGGGATDVEDSPVTNLSKLLNSIKGIVKVKRLQYVYTPTAISCLLYSR